MNFLQLFAAPLAKAADDAISHPTGGFLGYLQKNPAIAALYISLLPVAHDYLSKLDGQAPVVPAETAASQEVNAGTG